MSNKGKDLGRALYKSRFGKGGLTKNADKRKPMKSLLEESDLEKIFSMGELTNKDFTAIRVISNLDRDGILNNQEVKVFEQAKKEYASMLAIPRRPKGAREMSREDLLAAEKENFVMWRRQLAEIEKDQRVKMTPYEMNLDFWRQLWRVIERSDVLVQVVDGRNPLLFRNEDLELYVKEIDDNKINMLLINKADFLNEKQRITWAKYFDSVGLRVIFWSAKLAEGVVKEELSKIEESEEDSDDDDDNDSSGENIEEKLSEDKSVEEEDFKEMKDENTKVEKSTEEDITRNSHELVGVNQLLEILESIKVPNSYEQGKTTVGLVGYPNVGKSSTINAIYGSKKVSVSATPGHTKRFQTLNITDKLTFCDCPGLVMPSVVHSKGHLMVSGILPIDTIRDYIAPINIVADQFPRSTMEMMYGINLPDVLEGDNPNRPPTARELLSSYSYMHGMMTSKGNPNLDRAARIILKDYVDGKLLYCHPPPTIDATEFGSAADVPEAKKNKPRSKPPCNVKSRDVTVEVPMHDVIQSKLSKGFRIKDSSAKLKSSAEVVITCDDGESISGTAKPWRSINKRGTKVKCRIANRELDKHEYIYQ